MLFMSCVCHAFASVHCCLVATCWVMADLLALVCNVYCVILLLSHYFNYMWYPGSAYSQGPTYCGQLFSNFYIKFVRVFGLVNG